MSLQRITGLAAVAVAALIAAGAGLAAPAAPAAHDHKQHLEECAKVCADCQVLCGKNFHHCFKLVEAGKKDHAKAMRLSVDCAEFCTLAAKLTVRQSDLHAPACEACAKACDACAAECDKFPDMPEMKACAAKCRECAKSCREMAKMAEHGHDHHEKK